MSDATNIFLNEINLFVWNEEIFFNVKTKNPLEAKYMRKPNKQEPNNYKLARWSFQKEI